MLARTTRVSATIEDVTTVDQTMPALFGPAGSTADDALVPIAQLGAGPDGSAVLARRGDRLVEVLHLAFAPGSARWAELAARVRAIGAVDHAAIRGVLELSSASPPTLLLEGDNSPPLAELIEQPSVDVLRAVKIIAELARAIAAAHHIGICHGGLQPWSVHVGAGDRPRIELTQVHARATQHASVIACSAPELGEAEADSAADVFALGALLELFVTSAGRQPTPAVRALVHEATSPDPDARPSALELARRLTSATNDAATVVTPAARGSSVGIELPGSSRVTRPTLGLRLGRYELVKQLGTGAMGEVWQARDTTGGPDVAIKLLKPELASDETLLYRFRKEARVLAKVGSPYIANYVDLNEDHGLHYLVLELVTGGSVNGALKRLGRLPERLALGIVADTCRALAEPHRLGIVHRNLKPDNMMFVRPGIELESMPEGQLVKLGDFGIARLVESHAQANGAAIAGATREGSVLGTPEFMAPEQCQGTPVTAATDVYALGCALYALISGKPPFTTSADNPMTILFQHVKDVPPRLDALLPEVTPAVAELVARCLAKDPRDRPADASEVLNAIDELSDGGKHAIATAHPRPPVFRESRVQTYTLTIDLAASPEALWPFISNTEKMNRATGLAPVRFEVEEIAAASAAAPGGTMGGATSATTTGHQKVGGFAMRWREHPYEWIEGSRHVVLRVFDKGVLRWYVADVQLERLPGGGTRLRNTVRLEPRGTLARVLSKWEIGVKYRRRLERVYTRLDKLLAVGPQPEIDLLEPDVALAAAAHVHVNEAGDKLIADGVDPAVVDVLIAYLSHASDQDVARIRPLELAAKFAVAEDAMVEACLRAVKLGVLAMVWDVICPSCRIPSNMVESLAKIEQHARCKACNIGFDVDFSRAIELAFRASAELRAVETRTYCLGGPAHFPHVAAQVRLAPKERYALALTLGPGFYLVRSPQLPRHHEVRVAASGGVRRMDLTLGQSGGGARVAPASAGGIREVAPLTAGDQLIAIVNPTDSEILVRVERAGDRAFALTAARVTASAVFRELFPNQALAPGRLMAITQATLVVAQLDDAQSLFRDLGDAKAFPVAARFFEQVGALAKELGGTLVKTFGGLAIAAFERPGPAVEMALALQSAVDAHPVTTGLRARVAVHRGPLMALTHGGRLDYFGQNVEIALELADVIAPGVVGLTEAVCMDAGVAERLHSTPDQLGLRTRRDGSWVLQVRAPRAATRALPAPGDAVPTIVDR